MFKSHLPHKIQFVVPDLGSFELLIQNRFYTKLYIELLLMKHPFCLHFCMCSYIYVSLALKLLCVTIVTFF